MTIPHSSRAHHCPYAGTYGGYTIEPPPKWKAGILFRWGSLWVGVHWSEYNKRLCVNVVPCITVWVTLPGGIVP